MYSCIPGTVPHTVPPWGVDISVDVLTPKDKNERAYKGILL